jgi:PAS domain S-box-containing protein
MDAATVSLRKPEVTRSVALFHKDKDHPVIPVWSWRTEWAGPTEELFGFSIEEIENTEDWWMQRIHPDDREAVRCSTDELLVSAPKNPYAAESRISAQDYRFKHANGEYVLLSDRTIVNRDSKGKANRLESVVFDQEKRKKQRESFAKIFEAQNHLALIANNTQSGIFMMDPEGYCIYMNSVAEKITGFTFQEIYDYTFHASVHSCRPDGSFFPIHDCPVFCHQQAGTEAKNELEVFVHKDGHHYDIEYSVSPIGEYDTGGAVIEFRDVTERKRLERERLNAILMTEQQSIQIKADEAHKTNMTTFLAFVCHELRNPLQGMASSAEFLLETLQRMETLTQELSAPSADYRLDPKNLLRPMTNLAMNNTAGQQTSAIIPTSEMETSKFNARVTELQDLVSHAKQLVTQVSTCAEHQALITNNVLDLSRLDAGKVEPSFDILDVREAGRQSILMMSAKAQHKKIKLLMKESLAEPVYLKIDKTILRQVLLNLISNAIKFTQEYGNITLDFHVSRPDDHGRVTLHSSVTDDGLGMTEAEQKHLFQRFSQANRRVAQLYGGSGLGLSISKELVRVMGGEMHVKSEKGRGSTFSFTSIHDQPSTSELATIQHEHKAVTEVSVDLVNGTATSKEDSEHMPPKFRSVGVAEDNPMNLKILATHLTKFGYQFVLCTNGQEILDKVCEPDSVIDCCILDMSMPVMDGLEASRRIRSHESSVTRKATSQKMPIIALSGNALKEQVTAAMAAGCSDYLVKPCKQIDLARRLAYWERIVHTGAEHKPMLDMSLRG